MLNRFSLEILAKGKISQHFEEGVMPGGKADIFQIIMLATRPHAFLGRGRQGIIPRFPSRENVLERNHARIDEHQRRIVLRHQR